MSVRMEDGYGMVPMDVSVQTTPMGTLCLGGVRNGDDSLDLWTGDQYEIAAFFAMVGRAKADYTFVTGVKLP